MVHQKKITSTLLLALVTASLAVLAGASTDAEIIDGIVQFHRPRCGDEPGRGGRRPELIEVLEMGGDTNRLARLLAELAHTNDIWNAKMALWELEKYGTAEQLPFLYSCATNPAVGDRAVKAVLRIEGVTSNSMNTVHNYLFSTNWLAFDKIGRRSEVCCSLLKKVFNVENLASYRPCMYGMATNYLQNVELMPNALDEELCVVDGGFSQSKRRLAILRTAMQRVKAELEDVANSNYEVWRRTHCYTFQTNYLQNAINELVAYPEANLPD